MISFQGRQIAIESVPHLKINAAGPLVPVFFFYVFSVGTLVGTISRFYSSFKSLQSRAGKTNAGAVWSRL